MNKSQKIILSIGFIVFILRWFIFHSTDYKYRISELLIDWVAFGIGTGFFIFFLSHRKYLIFIYLLLAILFLIYAFQYGYLEHIETTYLPTPDAFHRGLR